MKELPKMQKEPIPSNYFNPRAYVKSDPASGLLSTRKGKRLIALPDLLINSIHDTLRSEAGEAASIAFYTFGFSWGKSFYERMRKEIESYYGTSIPEMNAPEFFATLQQLWGVHGLGQITVDFSHAQKGLLLVTVENSSISIGEENTDSKSFSVEAGFLSGWFSAQTGKDLSACATDWYTNPRRTQYLVGSKSHIEQIEQTSVSKGMRTSDILIAV
jgi:predicted hydrocarbon binding protein